MGASALGHGGGGAGSPRGGGGRGESHDVVERAGIELSERWVRRAHVVLACGETRADVARTAARVAALTDAPVGGVWTKCDVRSDADIHADTLAGVGAPPRDHDGGAGTEVPNHSDAAPLAVSA